MQPANDPANAEQHRGSEPGDRDACPSWRNRRPSESPRPSVCPEVHSGSGRSWWVPCGVSRITCPGLSRGWFLHPPTFTPLRWQPRRRKSLADRRNDPRGCGAWTAAEAIICPNRVRRSFSQNQQIPLRAVASGRLRESAALQDVGRAIVRS